jgi:hypothetical protein
MQSKLLDGLATGGAEAAAAGARFEITINLGADTERCSKSIAVGPNDIDPDDATGMLPAIAAIAMMGKSKGGGVAKALTD